MKRKELTETSMTISNFKKNLLHRLYRVVMAKLSIDLIILHSVEWLTEQFFFLLFNSLSCHVEQEIVLGKAVVGGS